MPLIEMRAVGPFVQNGFVVGCEDTREAVIIDPGDGVRELLAFADDERLAIRHILLTHAHVDHISGVGVAKRALNVPIFSTATTCSCTNAPWKPARCSASSSKRCRQLTCSIRLVRQIAFGNLRARPHHTPGHCPGGVCLEIGREGEAGKDLFVGDTLFAGSIGRTDLPGGDYATLMTSIRDVLFAFGDDARVYSGHGPATTIGHERRTNPFLASI